VKYLLSQRKYDITFAHSIKDWEIETENMGRGKSVIENEKDRNRETERDNCGEKRKERRKERRVSG
jgi:hypothetical protein